MSYVEDTNALTADLVDVVSNARTDLEKLIIEKTDYLEKHHGLDET